MSIIRRLLQWLLSFFQKSETPELDAKIEENKEQIKKIDEELKDKYDDVDDSMKEWE
jgi:hypothetical protein